MGNNCLYKALYRHILQNRYDCHIAYVSHTTNVINGHIDPIFLNICAIKQPTAIHTSHVIAKHNLM